MIRAALTAFALVCGVALAALAWRVDSDLRQSAAPEPRYHVWLAHDRAPTPGERR